MNMGLKWFENNKMLSQRADQVGPKALFDELNSSRWQYADADMAEARVKEIESRAGPLKECNSIYEVGAGKGAFYFAARAAGFKGTYYIADIPVMKAVLSAGGVEAIWVTEAPTDVDLFVAHYSLSEIPIAMRAPLLPSRPQTAYVIFQHVFAEMDAIDNEAYFSRWFTEQRQAYEHSERVESKYGGSCLYLWGLV